MTVYSTQNFIYSIFNKEIVPINPTEEAEYEEGTYFYLSIHNSIRFICDTAMAATIEPAVIIGGIKTAASEAYDASVIARMAGRSGAATQTGAKGIAFEIMASDKKNLFQAFKNELKTIQTKNPTAIQVDLVTISKDGNKVVERLQLKDIQSDSGINSLIKRVKNGDYRQAQLLGTDETAELYNAKAAAEGISKTMKKSGISTKSTQRIQLLHLQKIHPLPFPMGYQ